MPPQKFPPGNAQLQTHFATVKHFFNPSESRTYLLPNLGSRLAHAHLTHALSWESLGSGGKVENQTILLAWVQMINYDTFRSRFWLIDIHSTGVVKSGVHPRCLSA